jgi:hypothetical protein
VRYGVEVGRPDGRTTVETVVAEQAGGADGAPAAPAPAGTTVLTAPAAGLPGAPQGALVWLWRYPHDPHLPGLAAAAHPRRVRALLDGLDVGPGPVRVVPRTYRASRRAVLEVTRRPAQPGDGGATRWFIKVLPPSRTARVGSVHAAVAAVLRAPAPLAVDADAGTLLLAEVPGRSLRDLLADPTATPPDPSAVVDLQRRLAVVPTGLERAPARPFGVGRGAAALGALLPERAAAIAAVAAAARAAVDRGDRLVTVHGDLHGGQVLVDDDGGLGLVDLDGTGPGRVVDDAATVLAHALLVGRRRSAARARSGRWADGYVAAVAALVDPARVRRRAAGVLLGLAAGSVGADDAWRATAHARLDLAAHLAEGGGAGRQRRVGAV